MERKPAEDQYSILLGKLERLSVIYESALDVADRTDRTRGLEALKLEIMTELNPCFDNRSPNHALSAQQSK